MIDDDLVVCGWTIYYRTSDFPHHYAVRMWWVTPESELVLAPIAALCDSLEDARAQVPAGAYRLQRDPEDDPMIIETWL